MCARNKCLFVCTIIPMLVRRLQVSIEMLHFHKMNRKKKKKIKARKIAHIIIFTAANNMKCRCFCLVCLCCVCAIGSFLFRIAIPLHFWSHFSHLMAYTFIRDALSPSSLSLSRSPPVPPRSLSRYLNDEPKSSVRTAVAAKPTTTTMMIIIMIKNKFCVLKLLTVTYPLISTMWYVRTHCHVCLDESY